MHEPAKPTLKFNLDYRILAIALLVVVAVMLILWKPWSSAKTTDRTIDVTGQATISARPDEFVFYPTYDFKNSDQKAALAQMSAKSEEVVAGLKKLGVADKNIKTNSDGWAYPTTRYEGEDPTTTYALRLTVTTNTEALTQKVQDYLLTTTPTGTISPQSTFSEAKLKELQDKARGEATKNARSKAEQSAKNLGFKLKAVKTVNDAVGFGGIYPLNGKTAYTATDMASSSPSMAIQPGENDLSYSVTVTYYIK
jgi:uncharacterized protein YggE